MEKDDENYTLMQGRLKEYMDTVRQSIKEHCIPVNQWEMEEIELAFEKGFVTGFVAGKHAKKYQGIH